MADYSKYKESAFTHEEMQPMIVESDMTDVFDDLAKAFKAGHDAGRSEAADEIERLRDALYECARNLEEQVSASYWHVEQPFDANMQRRYDRDMARAHKALAALREKE